MLWENKYLALRFYVDLQRHLDTYIGDKGKSDAVSKMTS
jgi:hypothetical protein